MKSLLTYGKALFINIISLLITLFFITILYYYNVLDDKTYQLLKLIILLITIFIQSFSLGKKAVKKRYLSGISYGCIIIILLLIPTIFTHNFQFKLIFYYFIILGTSVLGSLFGFPKEKR